MLFTDAGLLTRKQNTGEQTKHNTIVKRNTIQLSNEETAWDSHQVNSMKTKQFDIV